MCLPRSVGGSPKRHNFRANFCCQPKPLREAELFLAGDVHDLRCARIELALCYVRIAYDPNSINLHQIEDLSANQPVGPGEIPWPPDDTRLAGGRRQASST